MLSDKKGVISSPAYSISNYPPLQECSWTINSPRGVDLFFQNDFRLADDDTIKVKLLSNLHKFALTKNLLGHSNLITCLTSFFQKKFCQTQKKKKKVDFGVF